MSATRPGLRVYFVRHADGRLTGILIPHWSSFFDAPPPSAYGATEDDVFAQLEVMLRTAEALGNDSAARYLWEEEFETRRITVEIHPQSVVEKRAVVGKRRIPLRLTYAWSHVPNGGFRVVLPRFGWWFIVEDLEIAPDILRSAVSSALLGEKPRWLYEFRTEGDEWVRAWTPSLLGRLPAADDDDDDETTFPELKKVAEDWVERASKGRAPALVAIDGSFVRERRLVERDPPASLLLVGGPGSGKTAWVRRLARQLVAWRRERPDVRYPRIWATSRDRIIAGMIYLGMWQQRALELVHELTGEGDYLYVDRLASFLQEQPDGSSLGEVFAPAVIARELSLVAECTASELERARRRHPALVDAFQLVRIPETPPSVMPELLVQYQARRQSRVTIHPEGMKRLVAHLDDYERATEFPGKGFRFYDWLVQASGQDRGATLYPNDVSRAYSRYSGLPLELISDDHPKSQDELAAELASRVLGQDHACRVAAGILARFKAGLNDPKKPCGSLFFVGPTGVGKTELAKQLARTMFGDESRMVRLDMSEYMTPGSAERLLEAGEGARSLAERVRQAPLSLVLFDELEKAHPEVFDVLLGILGEGRLTDVLGRFVDFRMTVIVMTSNLGTSEGAAIGFDGAVRADYAKIVRRHFRPEFFNRIDEIVSFRALTPADVDRIVDLLVDDLSHRTGLKRRNLTIDVRPEARRLLAQLGFHATHGARPLKRVIEERVITPVAVRMARDPAFRDRTIPVVLDGAGDGDAIVLGPRAPGA
ncbi:AAA family ATPase [Myxococcota bacterium]|nr:AAA family ATPase [Myxococcota bacterium]